MITDHSTNLHLRQEGVPRTFKEIVAVSTVNKRDIGRCFKIILKWHEDTKVGLVDSGDFMSRLLTAYSLGCVPNSCLFIHIPFHSSKILWTLGALKGNSKGGNMYCKEGFACFFSRHELIITS